MAEAKPPSTTDLFLLIAGLHVVKEPDKTAHKGEDYYLNQPVKTDERTLRDTVLNPVWFASPQAAWESVRYRDWLIATLAEGIASHKQEFTTISEPLLVSMDVLSKEFTRDMKGATDAIKQVLLSKANYERSFLSALSLGLSKHEIDNREVFTFGAGMRRRASLWQTESEALQADVEFFVPFFVVPSSAHPVGALFPSARSICAGIAISKSNGSAIGLDENKNELIAMRFNLRIPFNPNWRLKYYSTEYELDTEFGTPEIKIQKRIKATKNSAPGDWEKFGGWKKYLEEYCKLSEVGELLNAPIGPLLLEKISDSAGITDIILKQSKRTEIKTDLKEVKEDLKDTLDLLKSVWEWQPPKKENVGLQHSSQRKVGSLLESLGFMTSKQSGQEFEYSFKIAAGVTIWTVVDGILDELDGFPLWVRGLKSNTDKAARIALSLASQSETETKKDTITQKEIVTKKHYFGLAGLAYNIPLKTVPEKEPASKNDDEEAATIALSGDNFTKNESILIEDEEEEREEGVGGGDTKPADKGEKSTVEVLLHLGKWFSGETLDDNWYLRLLPKVEGAVGKQRVPLPGIRILPFKREQAAGSQKATFSWTLRVDLLSLGVDIKGTTKDGLTFLQGLAGHFGLGAIEVRLALTVSAEDINVEKSFLDRVSIGIGVKLKDLRLSLGPKEEDDKKKAEKGGGNEIIGGLQELLADDWVVVPDKKPEEKKVKTRLTAKKKDKFSISVGYLTPLKKSGHGTLDIQLYDEKGNRGKMALIPIDRQADPIYLRQIGIGLKGVENVELKKGLPDSAQLIVSLTGGFRLPVFELGFIGAKLIFPLNNPAAFQFALDGLDVSVKVDPIVVSGSFMKVGIEYAGSLTVDLPKASFSAMGFYGSLRLLNMSRDSEVITDLNRGNVHKKLLEKLTEKKIRPAAYKPIARGHAQGEWELYSIDDKRYTITDDDDKLNVLLPDKTFFIYAMLNAASGCGPTFGPIQFTGIALGYGYNRRVKIPRVENVAEFPLVQMVMGEGGYQAEDTSLELQKQLGKPLEDPVSVLEKMKDHLPAEAGQQFVCGGARFTISGTVDCFALIIVQWSSKEIEIALLGLARFRHPRDLTARAICYIEMQILMTIKPSEGSFKLQALLTNNSWIINKDCKLTGGFALFVWFGGDHKGDAVLTIGGYHPRFQRPEHYPIVPRLGLNWPVNSNLSIKGGVYLALTPSCAMLGAKLEATFHSGRISAWFTAYLDVIVNWSPFYFEAELGISLRVEASFFLTSIKVTIAASIEMWGPPVGGIAHIDLTLYSFDIAFGTPRPKELELIKSWQQFCHNFLNMSGGDRKAISDPVMAFPIVLPNLASGRYNLNTVPNARRDQAQVKPEDNIWRVRADQLELSASAAVPVTSLNLGRVKTSSPPEGIQERSLSGQPLMVTKPVALETKGLRTKSAVNKLGVHPMGKTLGSVLNVTMVRDDVSLTRAVDLSEWTLEIETGSLPSALWDPAKPEKKSEPNAKLMAECITGIKRLKPPAGKLGQKAALPQIGWHSLEAATVAKSGAAQEIPSKTCPRKIQDLIERKKIEQKEVVEALAAAGFGLGWKPAGQIRFRELQAEPLAGVVAP